MVPKPLLGRYHLPPLNHTHILHPLDCSQEPLTSQLFQLRKWPRSFSWLNLAKEQPSHILAPKMHDSPLEERIFILTKIVVLILAPKMALRWRCSEWIDMNTLFSREQYQFFTRLSFKLVVDPSHAWNKIFSFDKASHKICKRRICINKLSGKRFNSIYQYSRGDTRMSFQVTFG